MTRFLIAGLTLLVLPGQGFAVDRPFDVVVYGGTPGGVAAAVAAARHGARVVLLEQKRHVGGLTTSGLVNDEMHHMHEWTVTGVSREFYERLAKKYGREGLMHQWESKIAQEVFDEMLAEAGVPVRFHQRVGKVEKDGPRIRRIVMLDDTVVSGKVFIDATYEGDLMARSGVSYTFGRESRAEYGELLAGVQLIDPPFRADTRDENGNLLPDVNVAIDRIEPGQGDRKVQNYNFRLSLTQRKENRVPIPKPKSYDPGRFRMLAAFLAEYPDTKLRALVALYPRIGGKAEFNNRQQAIVCAGIFGGQFDYPDADYATQDRIYQEHVDYTRGLLYFLGHAPAVPEALRKEMLSWGLSKDEFVDNDHWPYYLYVREARRMIGPLVMTQRDVQDRRTKPDSICLGSHYLDSHHVQRVALSDREFTNEGRIWVPGKPYEIPYRAITPKPEQCDNLLVPVAASFSHVAFCTFRLEPTWMGAGHSAGVAAVIAAGDDRAVQDVEIGVLQEQLSADGQLLFLSQGPNAR